MTTSPAEGADQCIKGSMPSQLQVVGAGLLLCVSSWQPSGGTVLFCQQLLPDGEHGPILPYMPWHAEGGNASVWCMQEQSSCTILSWSMADAIPAFHRVETVASWLGGCCTSGSMVDHVAVCNIRVVQPDRSTPSSNLIIIYCIDGDVSLQQYSAGGWSPSADWQ